MRVLCLQMVLFVFLLICSFSASIAQQIKPSPLEFYHYTLDNGLQIFINPDPNAAYVSGIVAVKTGSKHDPEHATGIAHYLEHMLFKGTQRLGTVNYEKEKVYLDSISELYDQLKSAETKQQRINIQQHINQLSQKAANYAIPNELDAVLNSMGSTKINAFTGYDLNAYFNCFPKNQLRKWLLLNAHRFNNPVFRLFQSELETVFEEKNRYMDRFEMSVIQEYEKAFYTNHPYGKTSILGSCEDIKYPSLSEMKRFYQTYYVANNMAVILSGPIDLNDAYLNVKAAFEKFPSGDVPQLEFENEKNFRGSEKVTKRITPIRAGILGFRTVPNSHPDKVKLDVLHAMLNNDNQTGLLDKLSFDGKLLYSLALNDARNDAGGSALIYVPKLLFQTMKTAQQMVLSQIDTLRNGAYSNDQLMSVKKSLIKDHLQKLETVETRSMMMMYAFIEGKNWDDVMAYPEQVAAISKADITQMCNTYYGDNYLDFRTRMGFPRKEKLQKPNYVPVHAKNKNQKSDFAKDLQRIPVEYNSPDFMRFGRDVNVVDLTRATRVFVTENPINSIFNLKFRFQVSKHQRALLPVMAEYLMYCGTKDFPENKYQQTLQSKGLDFSVKCDNYYLTIDVSGFDSQIDTALSLIRNLFDYPLVSKSALQVVTQREKVFRTYERRNPDLLADALLKYVMYGDKSFYLTRVGRKQLKEISCDTLCQLFTTVQELPLEIHYSGKHKSHQLNEKLKQYFNLPDGKNMGKLYQRELKEASNQKIYFLNDKRAVQSQIYLYSKGNKDGIYNETMINAFNQYFGSDMGSVVFQEIREFRSLAYYCWAHYFKGFTKQSPGYFLFSVQTQSDKTIDALYVMDSLVQNPPNYAMRINDIKNTLRNSIDSNKPNFRNASVLMSKWLLNGYSHDPNEYFYRAYNDLEFDDILEFHTSHIKSKPKCIVIVGRKKDIDFKELKRFGEIIELKKNDIMN